MKDLVFKRSSLFILLVLLSPIFWWNLFNPTTFFQELIKTPIFFSQHLHSLVTVEEKDKINFIKWHTSTNYLFPEANKLYNPIFFIPLKEFFEYITYFSPRLFFFYHEGDSSKFYPPGVDPIPALLYPFLILGIVKNLKNKRFAVIILLALAAFLGYLIGRKTFPFLLPMYLIILSLTVDGLLTTFKSVKTLKICLMLLIVYSLYLFGRLLWLSF